MYDIAPPASKYAKLKALSHQEDSKFTVADRLTAATHRTRRDRYTSFLNILAQEFKEQTVSREKHLENRTKAVGGRTICLPGMQKSFLKDASKPVELSNLLTWPEYQKIVCKWYRKLAAVRNSLISSFAIFIQ
jgi:hypothetical protein